MTSLTDKEKLSIWRDLLKNLRALNVLNGKVSFGPNRYMDTRTVLGFEGVEVEVKLDQETHHGSVHIRWGRPYFAIGGWHRARVRPRAIRGKKGFDWGRIAQLISDEAKRLRRNEDAEKQRDVLQKEADKMLRSFYRRTGLKDLADVSWDGSAFVVEARVGDIRLVEAMLRALNEMMNETS